MKREIKFRGKAFPISIDCWAYGSLIQYAGDCWIQGEDGTQYKVAPDTVGQFTGLYDKNGKEIYEGDIVQLDYITTIGKRRTGLSFEVKWCAQEGCWVGWDGFVENALQQTRKMFVVKGSIHDNPELLKGGNDEE